MRALARVVLLGLVLGGAVVVVPSARADDPVAELAAGLAGDLGQVLAGLPAADATVSVLPTVDRSRRLTHQLQRLRKLLLLQLAGLADVRVLAVERAGDDGMVLATYLDTVEGALVLSGVLSDASGRVERRAFVLAVEGGALMDRLRPPTRPFRFAVVTAGESEGRVRAAAAGPLVDGGNDALVLVTDAATRVLALKGYGFREVRAQPHPAPPAPITSRDPRAGVVVLRPGQVWVVPPTGGEGYLLGGRTVRTDGVFPLGRAPGGRVLVGAVREATNELERVGLATGPDDRAIAWADELAPALDAAAGSEWVLLGAPNGIVSVFRGPALEPIGALGRFGSALAVLDLGLGSLPLAVGDRPARGVLSAVSLGTGFGDEVWQGAAPFEACALAAGDFNGDGSREVAVVGCDDPAPLALLVPEGRP